MKLVQLLLFLGFPFGLVIYLYKFGLSHLYDFRVGPRGVEIIVLGILPLVLIKFESIEAVQVGRFLRMAGDPSIIALFTSLAIGNRITLKTVVLTMKRGPFRYVQITPADPKGFSELVQGALMKQPARGQTLR